MARSRPTGWRRPRWILAASVAASGVVACGSPDNSGGGAADQDGAVQDAASGMATRDAATRGDGAAAEPDAASQDAQAEVPASSPSAGCQLAAQDARYAPGTTTDTLDMAGVQRSFRVHVPPGNDGRRALPL